MPADINDMKLKTKLLLAVTLLLVPEVLLVWYVASKYVLEFNLSGFAFEDFLAFLIKTPVIIIINIVFSIAFLVLYRALTKK
jgi:hypothetical protein